jgi:hypothetical protein
MKRDVSQDRTYLQSYLSKIVHIDTSELGSSSSQRAMVTQTNKYSTSIRLELFIFYEEKNLLAVGQ